MSSKHFQQEILINPTEIVGDKRFKIIISLRNLSSYVLYMEPLELKEYYGRILDINTTAEDSKLDNLENRKITLISDLELTIKQIYLKELLEEEEPLIKESGKRISRLLKVIQSLTPSKFLEEFYYNIYRTFRRLPENYERLAEIRNLEDLAEIEKTIDLTQYNKKSILIKSFNLNKARLINCINELEKIKQLEVEKQIGLRYIKVPSKSEVVFSYELKIPRQFKESSYKYIFYSKALDSKGNFLENVKIEKELKVNPSLYSIPLGAIAGAIAGYFLKIVFKNYVAPENWGMEIFGCVLLAFLSSFILRKIPGKKKFIPVTIDDFIGGLVLGILVGYNTDGFLNNIEKILKINK